MLAILSGFCLLCVIALTYRALLHGCRTHQLLYRYGFYTNCRPDEDAQKECCLCIHKTGSCKWCGQTVVSSAEVLPLKTSCCCNVCIQLHLHSVPVLSEAFVARVADVTAASWLHAQTTSGPSWSALPHTMQHALPHMTMPHHQDRHLLPTTAHVQAGILAAVAMMQTLALQLLLCPTHPSGMLLNKGLQSWRHQHIMAVLLFIIGKAVTQQMWHKDSCRS